MRIWVILLSPAVHAGCRERGDVGTRVVVLVLISFGRANKVTFYHSS